MLSLVLYRQYLQRINYEMLEVELKKFSQIPPDVLRNVKGFVSSCEKDTGRSSRFYWNCIRHRNGDFPSDYLCYFGEQIILYVAVFYFVPHELEICMQVNPVLNSDITDIIEAVIYQLQNDWAEQDIRRIKFTVNELDEAVTQALKNLEMKQDGQSFVLQKELKLSIVQPESLNFRIAELDDIDALVEIQCETFSSTQADEFKEYLRHCLPMTERDYCLIYDREQQIGKLHLLYEEEKAIIYDFAILPEFQKKGYGRRILNHLLPQMLRPKTCIVQIEVEMHEELVGFYQKQGFEFIDKFVHYTYRDIMVFCENIGPLLR